MSDRSALESHDTDARSFHPQIDQRFAHRLCPFSAGLPRLRHPLIAGSAVSDNDRRPAVGGKRHGRAAELRHIAPVNSVTKRDEDAVEAGFAGVFSHGLPASIALGQRVTRPDKDRRSGPRGCCPWHRSYSFSFEFRVSSFELVSKANYQSIDSSHRSFDLSVNL